MNVLSLFDGQSVGRFSLKKSKIKVDNYFSSEIEEAPMIISKDNHNDITYLGDVNNWREWELPKIDLLIGGSPCQGFSRQGTGLNFEHPQSKLFFVFVEVLQHIKKLNPNLKFMLENVDMKKEWENVITEYMQVQPIHINSDLLLPHNRPRTYWTNIDFEIKKQRKSELEDLLENVVLTEPIIKDGIVVDKSFSEKSINLVSFEDKEIRIKQPVKKGYAVADIGDGINISFPTSKSRRGRVVKGRSSCLDTTCDIGVLDNQRQIRRYTIRELERLQGLPDNYTAAVSENLGKKALGNGWTANVITEIFKGLKRKGMEQ